MRAKIMLLCSNKIGDKVYTLAEQLLTDVSAAFGHSFSLMRGKAGDAAQAITDETLDNCQQCQGILLCDGISKATQDLYDALDLPLRIRSLCIPEALCARREQPVSFWLAQALSVDEQTIRSAMASAFRFAQDSDAKITHVPPNGASRGEWMGAIRVHEVKYPSLSTSTLSGPDAMTSLITSPSRLGVMLCPPYAGGMLHAAAVALCPFPGLMYEASFDETIGVYGPVHLPHLIREEDINPFSCALAVAALLRFSLRLSREAACVEAAVNNVLSSGWRSHDLMQPGMQEAGPDDIIRLICEQITVAGELMNKAGIR